MDRNEFRKRMQDLKSYKQSNPDKGYWDWKTQVFAEGGEVDDNREELLARQEESKRRLAAEKNKTKSTELTESEKRAQQDIDLVMNAMRDQADRISGKEFSNKISESLNNVEQERIEDFNEKKYNYSLLLKSLGVAASAANIGTSVNALYRNYQFNNTLSNLKGYNDYLSVAQRLDKANKINNLTNLINTSIDIGQAVNNPTDISNVAQIVGNVVNSIPTNSIPLKAITTLINTGTDALSIKDVKDITSEFAEGGEVNDYDKQQQISNAITYALNRGNIDTAKSLMRRGTPDNDYYYPQSGAIDPVFSLYDTPVLGDAMFTTDAARYAMNGDWTNAGLAMAGLIIPGVVGKGIKKVNRHIPSVKGYKESVERQIDNIMSPKDLQKQSDWNEMLYRSLERVYDKEVIDRAIATGTTDRLNLIKDLYENHLEELPKIRMVDDLNGARARIQLTEEAEKRYKDGVKPQYNDFEILVRKDVDPSMVVTNHESGHWGHYITTGSPNIDVTSTSARTGVQPRKINKLDPNLSGYFSKQGELEEYLKEVYFDMRDKKYKLTPSGIKKYYNNLKDTDSKKKAIAQFESFKDAYKWMMNTPLIATAGVVTLNRNSNKENNKSN